MGAWRRLARGFCRRWTAPAGLAVFALVLAMAASAPYVFPEDPFSMVTRPLQWPGENRQYLLGSDMLGRDLLAGICHGARVRKRPAYVGERNGKNVDRSTAAGVGRSSR